MSLTDSNAAWQIAHGRSLPLGRGVLVMGVLNVTPDSFFEAGRFLERDAAAAHGLSLAANGADIIDIGGESTRPGSRPVPPAEQIRRVVPVIERLGGQCPAALSVDTRSAEVAEAALAAGAHIVNDISALRGDPQMAEVATRHAAGVVLMHMQGTPATMQIEPAYEDVVAEVRRFLADRARAAVDAGLQRERIVIDPGIGFGKKLEHNLLLLRSVDRLAELGYPVLVGPSRKRFIGELTGAAEGERLAGTLSACIAAVAGGARIVRVHDPGPVRQALVVAEAIRAGRRGH